MNDISNGNARGREREATNPRTQTQTTTQTATKPAEAGGVCPKCGAAIKPEYELCPVCGWKAVDYCTFCGAPMTPEDIDCPECGMPADGVVCPDCKTRNFRPFCKQCGKPLSRAARMAVEKAKKDPKVQETARLLKQIADLQAELESAKEELDEEVPEGPTEGELRLKELMAKVGFTPAETPKPVKRKKGRSREEIMAEYKKTIEDANRIMEEMLPPAGSTPQEQRNYYTARKVAVMEIMEEQWYGIAPRDSMAWECNTCHVLHNSPSECHYQNSGGQWTSCKEWTVVDEGTEGAVLNTSRVEKIVYKR